MIFVTVGTNEEPFDRLVREVDRLAPQLSHEVVAQIGYATIEPANVDEWFRFTNEERIERLYQDADIVIGHAGAGTILMALVNDAAVVVVPRRQEYGEYRTEHQLDLAEAITDRPGVFVVHDIDDLHENIESAARVDTSSIERSNQLQTFLAEYVSA